LAKPLTPDICVIGAGSAGLAVAAGAAAFGVRVVLIEKGEMGGDCLNSGCVPSKALIAAAKRAEAIRAATPFGIAGREPEIDPAGVGDHVRGVITRIAPNDSVARFTAMGVTVIKAQAQFKDERTLVTDAAEIRARRFVIATGSRPVIPPIPGLGDIDALTNETVFQLRVRPDHLVVIGAGPVGLELAQAHRRLGARVTVVEAAQPLAKDDPECARIVVEALTREGVDFVCGAKVTRVAPAPSGVSVFVDAGAGEAAIEASHMLVATGRRPVVEGLGLDKAGVAFDENGIAVGRDLRTTNRRVYAIGDVAGSWQLTHLANHHAGLVLRAILFRLPVRSDTRIIPWVTFTDPELAHVGTTEAQARALGEARVLRWSFHENDRAQTERLAHGHVKLVTTKRGRLLGASIVGPQAGETIALLTMALRRGMGVRELATLIFPYPTLSEAVGRAAMSFYGPHLTRPLTGRILALLRQFG
jgi:pyruvate/2-oxoglutarate dehydrogenase complex dihydrolipoamide dehydrogenase (E3) component